MIQVVRLRQSLPLLQKALQKEENETTMTFLEQVGGQHVSSKKIPGPLGRVINKRLNEDQVKSLEHAGFKVQAATVPTFRYCRINGVVFSSSRKGTMRDSSICQFRLPSHEVCFGSIAMFCLTDGVLAMFISVFEATRDCFLSEGSFGSLLQPDDHVAAKCANLFFFNVKKLSITNRLVAISPEHILGKCVHIPIKHYPTDCIVTSPNYIEHH